MAGGPSKRKAGNANSGRQVRRTFGGSGNAPSRPRIPDSVTLSHGAIFRFDALNIGSFRIQGGSGGPFFIDEENVTISDLQGNQVFSEGGPGDRITIRDDFVSGTTIVTLLRGQGIKKVTTTAPISTGTQSGSSVQSQANWFGSSHILIADGNATISSGGSTDQQDQEQQPIPIRAFPYQLILLRGTRNFVITGNSANLSVIGFCDVIVHGDLANVDQVGGGNISVRGKVHGNLVQTGIGKIEIVGGGVFGSVKQTGMGKLDVNGDITGEMSQCGMGTIDVNGAHLGYLKRMGMGTLNFH